MKRSVGLTVSLLLAFFYFSSFVYATTIVFKSGKTVEGEIIERTDDYIKVDFYGTSLTYYLDEIANIEGKSLSNSKAGIISAEESLNIEGKEIISKINNAASRIEGFKASIIMKMNKGAEASSTIGKVLFKKPNKSNMQGIISAGVDGELRNIEQIMISDGEIMWIYLPAIKKAMKLHLTLESSPPIGSEVVNPIFGSRESSIIYKGIEEREDKKFYIFDGETEGAETASNRPFLQLVFNVSDNLLYQKATYNETKTNIAVVSYDKIELNMPISNSDFTLSLPNDVIVEDI